MRENKSERLDSQCVICARKLTKDTLWVYAGDPMHAIIGPGYRNQLSQRVKIYCDNCGIEYFKEPQK